MQAIIIINSNQTNLTASSIVDDIKNIIDTLPLANNTDIVVSIDNTLKDLYEKDILTDIQLKNIWETTPNSNCTKFLGLLEQILCLQSPE